MTLQEMNLGTHVQVGKTTGQLLASFPLSCKSDEQKRAG